MTIKEIVRSADNRIAQANYRQRVERKQARDEQRRKDQRRCYAVGELVIKHFPELLCIEPGSTKAETALRFAPLEAFPAELAADQELVEQIKARAHPSNMKWTPSTERREKRQDRLMANYHLSITTISRGKGQSVARRTNYISGQRLHDCYTRKTYYDRRHDVLYCTAKSSSRIMHHPISTIFRLSATRLSVRSIVTMPAPLGSSRDPCPMNCQRTS